jgi:predicted transcriptional regulator
METAAADSRLIELASDIVAAYVSKTQFDPRTSSWKKSIKPDGIISLSIRNRTSRWRPLF